MDLPKNENLFDRILYEYLDYIKTSQDYSPLTFRNYEHYLKRFAKWANSRKLKKLDMRKINDYKKFLRSKGLSKRTQSYHIIALRSFIRWAGQIGAKTIDVDNIKVPKATAKKPKVLKGSEVDMLLNAPSISSTLGLRDKAILELIFSTGIRVSDLVNIDREDIDFVNHELELKNRGKREKRRLLNFSQRASSWMQRYLNKRGDSLSPLFIRHKGKKSKSDESMRLSTRSVQRMVKKYVRKMNLPDYVTPHTLRHSMAVNLLNLGAEYGKVQRLLGHKNLETTEAIYS